ncbi:universal stress protein [Pontibacter toksunensis]|uniref:Universal stress protein n=1 Tax=Pontibacter toksunensis TaxID=1332631 RepID=A0ABW6BUR0_9BACT
MKTILVPVDYSPNSKSALLYALKLAQKANLNVVVFHAFQPIVSPPAAYDIPTFIPELENEKVQELEQYVKACKSTLPDDVVISYTSVEGAEQTFGLAAHAKKAFHTAAVDYVPRGKYATHVTYVAKMGPVYGHIIKLAEANKVDLIVMGMQGGGALNQVLIGSTTLSVMRNSKFPVLGVPLGAKFCGVKSVVFASDLSRQPDKLLLTKLREFVKTFRAELQVLHIDKQQDPVANDERFKSALEVLDKQLYDMNYKVVLQQRPDVATGIQEYLQERKPDLLILSPQKHNILERLLDRSVTSKMVAYNHLPLLTLPLSTTDNQHKVEEEMENMEEL